MKTFVKILLWIFRILTWFVLCALFINFVYFDDSIALDKDNLWDPYAVGGEIIGVIMGPFIILAILYPITCLLSRWYHKLCKKKKATTSTEIEGPYILYLRSFVDDDTASKSISKGDPRTEEEYLIDVLNQIAPVYAIGNPLDKKMPLGAIRLYVDDDKWKDTVVKLAKNAVLVVLRLGETNNFWWEIDTTLKLVDPQKLLYVIPHLKNFSRIAVLYKHLIEHGIDVSNFDAVIEKTNKGSISSFVYFDENNVLKCSQVKVHKFTSWFVSYEKVIRNALNEKFAQFGLQKARIKIKSLRLMQILLILLAFLFSYSSYTYYLFKKNRLEKIYYEDFLDSSLREDVIAQKYGTEKSLATYIYCLLDAKKGYVLLDDEEFEQLIKLDTYILKGTPEEWKDFKNYNIRKFGVARHFLTQYGYEYYIDLHVKAACLYIQDPESAQKVYNNLKEDALSVLEDVHQTLVGLGCPDDYIENAYIYDLVKNFPEERRIYILKVHYAGSTNLFSNAE